MTASDSARGETGAMTASSSVRTEAGAPACQPPDLLPRVPVMAVPPLACDCHAHIFGDPARYPLVPGRRYTPSAANLDDYRAMLAALGLQRAVIVQPTIYPDNQVTIDALQSAGGQWRGIARLDAGVTQQELERLHAIGFRGVRFHPRRADDGGLERLEFLCARIAPLGWHVQFHLDARDLGELAPRIEKLPVACVIDHLGHMAPAGSVGIDEPGFQVLLRWLREERAWVKLSAPNRFGDPLPPYPQVLPFARALVAANPGRVLWGSDWPHSSHKGFMPNDADLLDLLALWAPDEALRRRILVDNPAELYGFPRG
jgi:predicted TIM-barrel fold metal-dependent hydrolase